MLSVANQAMASPSFPAASARYHNPWLFVGSTFMSIAAGLYTTFTAFDTPSRSWIGFQILQGLGVGLTMQVPTLILQQELEGSPLLPIGVSLGLFSQYLGATVSQVVAGSIFNTSLRRGLDEAGLTEKQVGLLLQSGTAHVRQTVEATFPDLLVPILGAYNFAISRVYVSVHPPSPESSSTHFPISCCRGLMLIPTHHKFVPIAASMIAFAAGCFLRWRQIETDKGEDGRGNEQEGEVQGGVENMASGGSGNANVARV